MISAGEPALSSAVSLDGAITSKKAPKTVWGATGVYFSLEAAAEVRSGELSLSEFEGPPRSIEVVDKSPELRMSPLSLFVSAALMDGSVMASVGGGSTESPVTELDVFCSGSVDMVGN